MRCEPHDIMKTSQLFHKPMTDADAALPPADMETLVSSIATAKANTVIKGSGQPIREALISSPTASAEQAERASV